MREMILLDRAGVRDADAILALQKLAYQSEAAIYNDLKIPALVQTKEQMLEDMKGKYVVKATLDSKIIGSVRGYDENGTCYIGRLIVNPDLQGNGIGSKLLAEIEYQLRLCKRYEVSVGHRSEKNIAFFEKRGYRRFREQRVSDSVSLLFLEKNSKGMKTLPVVLEPIVRSGQVYNSAEGYFGIRKPSIRSVASIEEQESMRAREIAIGNYVLARTCVFEGYLVSSALLAEQAMEMYVKAVIKFRGKWVPEKMERIHDIIALMKLTKQFPEFSEILRNREQLKFLHELKSVYGTMRFGEAAVSGVDSRKLASMLDSLAFVFESIFVGGQDSSSRIRIFVHDDLRETFLLGNRHFTPEMITDNLQANRMPGLSAPEMFRVSLKKGLKEGEALPKTYYFQNSTAGSFGAIILGTTAPLTNVKLMVGDSTIKGKRESKVVESKANKTAD